MANIDTAFTLRNGVSLDDDVGIFHGSVDPSSSGYEAPIGSLYLRESGELYIKTDSGDTAWELVQVGSGGGVTKYKCSIKTSGGTFAWSGSDGSYTATITAASHGISISDYDVVVKCFQLDTDYIEVIPTEIRIESDDDIVIEMPTNDDLYVMVLV